MSTSFMPRRTSQQLTRLHKTRRSVVDILKVQAVLSVLGVCILGVYLIAKFFLGEQSLRLDEAQSLWQASHTLEGMLKVVAQDVHVPLYHVILHYWQLELGSSITTVRALSLLFFIISIPLMYVLSRQLLSRPWALLAVVLFSFSPFMNWYGSETRMYTMLALVSILNHFFFIRILKQNKGWLGYALTTLAGVYTHYFFLFSLLTQVLFYLYQRRKFPSGSLKKFASVAVAAVLALLPWLYYFRSQGSGANTSPLLPTPSSVDFFNAFSNFSFGFQTDAINTILLSCWPLIVLIGFFAIRKNQRFSPGISYLMCAAILPVVIAFGLSFIVEPFFISRYMISVIPPLTIVLVWFISQYNRRYAVAAGGVILLIVSMATFEQLRSAATPVKEDYKSAAQHIEQEAKPQDLVVLSAPFTVFPFEYYYEGDAKINTLPIWQRDKAGAIPAFDNRKLPADVARLNSGHQYIYLLLSQDQGYEENIRDYYEQRFERKYVKHYSPDVELRVYRVGYNQVPALGEL